jgi:hypothetical protein
MRFAVSLAVAFATALAAVAGCSTGSSSSSCARTIDAECGGDAGFVCPMTFAAIPTCGGETMTCGTYKAFATGAPGNRRITFYYDPNTGALVGLLDEDTVAAVGVFVCNGASFSAPACGTTTPLPACTPGPGDAGTSG